MFGQFLISRSPKFYDKFFRWFRRKRRNSDQFPTEKHYNLKHCANKQNLCSKLSTSSGRQGEMRVAERLDTLESGYHSISPASSLASSKSKLSTSPRLNRHPFEFLRRKFQLKHASFSEENHEEYPGIETIHSFFI